MTQPAPIGEASRNARRQLRRVLLALALLDAGVLVAVVVLAEAWSSLRLTNFSFLLLVLAVVGFVLATRLAMAVRLRRRSGDL